MNGKHLSRPKDTSALYLGLGTRLRPGVSDTVFYASSVKPGRVGLVARWWTCPWRRAAGEQGNEGRAHPECRERRDRDQAGPV